MKGISIGGYPPAVVNEAGFANHLWCPMRWHVRQQVEVDGRSVRERENSFCVVDRDNLVFRVYGSLAIVAAYTGLRWGELAGLRITDVDMLRRRLTVRAALIEASDQPPKLGMPKSKTTKRTITLPQVVIETLAHHLGRHPPVDQMIWTTQQGRFLRRGSFGRIWRRAVADSVGAPCRIHGLRHTHASWLIAAGEHPKAIQTRLGHSSIQVTIDRYGHLMDGLDDQTADRLDAIAQTVRGPGVAQTAPPTELHTRGNPR